MLFEKLTIGLIALFGCAFWPTLRLFQEGEEIEALLLFFAALVIGGLLA